MRSPATGSRRLGVAHDAARRRDSCARCRSGRTRRCSASAIAPASRSRAVRARRLGGDAEQRAALARRSAPGGRVRADALAIDLELRLAPRSRSSSAPIRSRPRPGRGARAAVASAEAMLPVIARRESLDPLTSELVRLRGARDPPLPDVPVDAARARVRSRAAARPPSTRRRLRDQDLAGGTRWRCGSSTAMISPARGVPARPRERGCIEQLTAGGSSSSARRDRAARSTSSRWRGQSTSRLSTPVVLQSRPTREQRELAFARPCSAPVRRFRARAP